MTKTYLCGIVLMIGSLVSTAAKAVVLVTITPDNAHINATNNAGTTSIPSTTGQRLEQFLVSTGDVTNMNPGPPISQSVAGADSYNYWDSADAVANRGLIIDLGAVRALAAIQIYGWNFGGFESRSMSVFDVFTATDPGAAAVVSGSLLVSNIGDFTQQGGQQTLAMPVGTTFGETYLFHDASQPSDVTGTTHNVTGDAVAARYLFLTNMNSYANDGFVSLGEIRIYEALPEPGSAGVAAALAGFAALRRRSRRA